MDEKAPHGRNGAGNAPGFTEFLHLAFQSLLRDKGTFGPRPNQVQFADKRFVHVARLVEMAGTMYDEILENETEPKLVQPANISVRAR